MDKVTYDNIYDCLDQIKADVRRCKRLVELEYRKNME